MDCGIGGDSQGLVGQEAADADTFIPGADVFAVGASAVGGNHSAERAVDEDARACSLLLDAVIEGADKVRREDCPV